LEGVLNFWFGPLKGEFTFPEDKARLWFRGGEALNQEIRESFGEIHALAQARQLDHWQDSPRGTLALLILLDQFSRNLNDDGMAFVSDSHALEVAKAAVKRGDDLKLKRVERAFIYLPFEHSEDIKMQEQSVRFFEQLCVGVPPAVELMFSNMLDYARQHYEIIKKFGRFPHRNKNLGRESTAEEVEFLKKPGSSF